MSFRLDEANRQFIVLCVKSDYLTTSEAEEIAVNHFSRSGLVTNVTLFISFSKTLLQDTSLNLSKTKEIHVQSFQKVTLPS